MLLRRGVLVLLFFLGVSPLLAQSGGPGLILPSKPQSQAQPVPYPQRGLFPWKAGDAPPPVAGIRLGEARPRFEEVLGQPTDTQKLGADGLALTYQQRGVQVLYAPADGAAVIYLLTRAAGDIGGVRLGDKGDDVMDRWGQPTTVAGPMAIYRAGEWAVFVKLGEDQKVKQLCLGRVIDQIPKGAHFYRKND